MNHEEAKRWLSGFHEGDDADEREIAEALALLEKDVELQKWWAREQMFDSWVSKKLDESPVPSSLRPKILNRNPNKNLESFHTPISIWSVMAVAAVILLLVGFAMALRPEPQVTFGDVMKAGMGVVSRDDFKPEHFTPDLSEIRQWIQARGGMATFRVQSGLQQGGTIGCRVIKVRGVKVSIICFHSPDQKGALHLIVFDRAKLIGTPPVSALTSQNGNWSSAYWADENHGYVLVTNLGMDAIQAALKNS